MRPEGLRPYAFPGGADVITMEPPRTPGAGRRNGLLIAAGSIAVVIAVVAGLFVVRGIIRHNHAASQGTGAGAGQASGGSQGIGTAAPKDVLRDVTTVPASTLNAVGGGPVTATGSVTAISGVPLSRNGKPVVFYDGAEYCPYCATERWSLIVALSRFGTFRGLTTIRSSATDDPPSIPTWTFYRSKYTSPYLTFASVEELGNVADAKGTYPKLQAPTLEEKFLISKWNSQGSIPFIDYGNKYDQIGDMPGFTPQVLEGHSWAQIAAALKDPTDPTAQAVDGAANWTTAVICTLTNNQPATACTPAVQALEAKL
jgi:hypothetical protein